ncbi:MAG: hypothetical protein RLZZ608_764 [Actinomycetota bacterium]
MLTARDARFDGQFIAGVHSTGIYCRPSCPATTPRPTNVKFYATAAAAHDAGLRACKRCQPDAVPGNPEWNLRDDLVGRAMRLILDGVVEREGVTGLAARLGYSTRHVTRVLTDELGAGALSLARAHRAETARTLLAGTELPASHVAFAAGFSSIRQFNDTVREVYGLTPTDVRGLARSGRFAVTSRSDAFGGENANGTTVTLRLAARAPFDGHGVMKYIADHAVTDVERMIMAAGDDSHERAVGVERWIELPHGAAFVRVTLDSERPGLHVSARLAALADVAPLTARIRRWFDLDADAAAIDAALGADSVLAPFVAATPGIRIPGSVDPAETLVRTIVGQQISLPAARTVLGRLAADLDDSAEPGALRRFPTAETIARHGARVLRGPERRVRTIIDTARALASGALTLDVGLSTPELRDRLMRMPGIGPWTADYVALRVLGSPDVLLDTDLVLLRSLSAYGAASTPREAAALGRRWAPWRSYATLHLWRAAPPPVRRASGASSRARPSAAE